jgi:hypothetical protein
MQTEREYLVSLDLAKPGRGRFSAAAKAALDEARANGVKFAEKPKPAVKATVSTKPSQAKKVDKPKSSHKPGQYDPKTVRKWAVDKGLIESGKRGRLPEEVIHKYVSEFGASAPVSRGHVPKVSKPKVRKRDFDYAWHLHRAEVPGRTDVAIQFGDCAGCRNRIGFCDCKTGPIGPKWLGSPVLVFQKP